MARRRHLRRHVCALLRLFAESLGSRSAAAEPEGSGPLQNWAPSASVLGFLSSDWRNPLTMPVPDPARKTPPQQPDNLPRESAAEKPTPSLAALTAAVPAREQ